MHLLPADEPRLDEELRRLRRLAGPDTVIFAAGQAVGGYDRALRSIEAEILPDMQSFRDRLDEVRRSGAPT